MLLQAELRTELRNALQSGTRKMESWLTAIGASPVGFSDFAPGFANINTPDDLTTLDDAVIYSR